MKKTDPSVIEFMTGYSAPERLNPRDTLFGGRTNAYKLYHKVSGDEKIRYLDFTSLYPPSARLGKATRLNIQKSFSTILNRLKIITGLSKRPCTLPANYCILFSLTDAKENSCFRYVEPALTIKTRPRAVPTRMRKDHSPAPGYPLSFKSHREGLCGSQD